MVRPRRQENPGDPDGSGTIDSSSTIDLPQESVSSAAGPARVSIRFSGTFARIFVEGWHRKEIGIGMVAPQRAERQDGAMMQQILNGMIFGVLLGGIGQSLGGQDGEGRRSSSPRLDVYERTIDCQQPPLDLRFRIDGLLEVKTHAGSEFFTVEGEIIDRPDLLESFAGDWDAWSAADGTRLRPLAMDHRVEVIRPDETSGGWLAPDSFGDYGARWGLFNRPLDLAVHEDRVFVVDSANHRVQVFSLDGTFLYHFGVHQLVPRRGEGHLHYPAAVAISPDGERVFVAEPIESRVQIFRARRPEDPPRATALSWERVDLTTHYGQHWAIREPWLIISEPDAERVAIYQIVAGKDPARVGEVGGTPGNGLGQFRGPGDVAFYPGEPVRAAVLDRGNHRVQIIELKEWEGPLRFDPHLVRVVRARKLGDDVVENWSKSAGVGPETCLAIDRDSHLWVGGSSHVSVFDRRLAQVNRFSTPELQAMAFSRKNRSTLLAATANSLVDLLEGSEFPLNHVRPKSLASFSDGSWVLTDGAHHRLVFVNSQGQITDQVGEPGVQAVQFFHPSAVAVDDSDRIWVLDHGNHRGQVLDRSGRFLWAFGSRSYLAPIRAAMGDSPLEPADEATPPRRLED